MREILFRGKSLYSDDWLCGYIRQYENGKVIICDFETKRLWFVDPETVGQFTGLTDKNGKKIFEGDILRFMAYGTVYTGKVQFLNGAFWVKCRFNNRIGKIVHEYKPEIIGNIHDNPELLNEERRTK